MMVDELKTPSPIIYAVIMQMRREKCPKLTDLKSEVTNSFQHGLRCFSPSSDQIEFKIKIKLSNRRIKNTVFFLTHK